MKYYNQVHDEIEPKVDAGFDTSLTDYWGRALSRHLVNNSNDGLQSTFSSVQNLSTFTSHAMPFPIIISNGRAPGEVCLFTRTATSRVDEAYIQFTESDSYQHNNLRIHAIRVRLVASVLEVFHPGRQDPNNNFPE